LLAGRTKSTYITNYSTAEPKETENKSDKIVEEKLNNIVELVEDFEFEKFFETIAVKTNDGAVDNSVMEDFSYTLFISEKKNGMNVQE
jgi:hypothetical protein